MCNLSKGVYEKAVDKTLVDSIIKLMKKKNWDIEECLDTLDIPDKKRDLYKSVVEAELQLA